MRSTRGLQLKLAVIFIATTAVILVVNDFLMYWNTRMEMEKQLGSSLETIAAATAVQVDNTMLLHLLEKNRESRTLRNMQMRLKELVQSTGVEQIYLFNKELENLVDSSNEYAVGAAISQLRFEQEEMEKVFNGITASSILFTGTNDKLYKSGFAPIVVDNKVLAAVGVAASADFLDVLREIRRQTFMLGLICVTGAVMAALIFSRTLVKPLSTLVTATRQIGRGKFHKPVPVSGSDEIGFLGKTIEEMRINILKRDQQLKMMIASIAHEIRNPLGGIELFAELVQNNLSKVDENHQLTQKILDETRKLKSTLTSFLEYAKSEAPEKNPCRLRDIVDQVRPFIEKDSTQNNVIIHYQPADGNNKAICDERHFAQILLNLLQNAVHAMPNGGMVTIDEEFSGDHFIFRISDKGKGIPEKLKGKIFEPFVTSKEKGTGLGLAIVKKLIEENGGEIELLKTGTNGTTFQIKLISSV